MGEERYWIVHGRTSTSIRPDADGHPALRSVYRRPTPDKPVDDLVARVTAEARARGNVALFRDHWLALHWGVDGGQLNAQAGRLADAFRPRPLPVERDTGAHPPMTIS